MLRLVAAAVALSWLTGCVTAPRPVVKTAPTAQAVAIAPGHSVQPLSLTAFRVDVPPGSDVDYVEGGLACVPAGLTKSKADVSAPAAQQLLLTYVATAFENRGYLIDRAGQAALTLTPALVAYTTNICHPYSGMGDRWSGHGKVWVQMRWVVAERDGGAVLLDLQTEGDAAIANTVEQIAADLMRLSIDHAAGNLMAEPAFVALLGGDGGETSAAIAPAPTQAAPIGPSKLSTTALASAQSAFDDWLAGNRQALIVALESHLTALGQPAKGGVASLDGAAVQDLTAEGYVVRLAYGTAGGGQSGLFLVALNEGRLQRLVRLT